MAYFAKLGINNIVTNVSVVVDEIVTTEQAGIDFLNNLFKTNDVWKQTYIDGNQRKHYAGIGFTYREDLDAFIPAPVFNSWILNETTYLWEAPISYPITSTQNLIDEYNNPMNDIYYWNEQEVNWEL